VAYQIDFDGPISVEGKDNNAVVLLGLGAPPAFQLRGAFLGTMVDVSASGHIAIKIKSDAALERSYVGGRAGRTDAQIVVKGKFIIRRGANDPKTVTVQSTSTATLSAKSTRQAAGDALMQAEARVDTAFDQITDRKRRREDINLANGNKQRFDNDFTNPTGNLVTDQSYDFSVLLVLEASKIGAPGRGVATALFGASPGVAEVSLAPVQPKKKTDKREKRGKRGKTR